MTFLCIFNLFAKSATPLPLLLLTFIVMQEGVIIQSGPRPLHTSVNTADPHWVWMGVNDRFLLNTHTDTHALQRATHLLPKPNNSPFTARPFCWPISLSRRCPIYKSKGKQTEEPGRVVVDRYSLSWCQQPFDLSLCPIRPTGGKINISDIIKDTDGALLHEARCRWGADLEDQSIPQYPPAQLGLRVWTLVGCLGRSWRH